MSLIPNDKTTKISENRKPLIDVFMERNAKINLSAIRNPDDIYTKHILDALELTKIDQDIPLLIPHIPPTKDSLLMTRNEEWLGEGLGVRKKIIALDLGTWWWFPLLPLALTYPHIQRTWLDARRKKIDAINNMISQLDIPNCTAIHGRVSAAWVELIPWKNKITNLHKPNVPPLLTTEESDWERAGMRVNKKWNTSGEGRLYNLITARAVAYIDTLFPRIDALLAPWWHAVLYKLWTVEEDTLLSKKCKKNWRAQLYRHQYTLWQDTTPRIIYVLKKPE